MFRKSGKVYLVTSGCAGSGRSMLAVILATCLTQRGKVALIADQIGERRYFGVGQNVPMWSNWYHPGPESWQGLNAQVYARENLLFTDTFNLKHDQGYFEYLRGSFDYVVICSRVDWFGENAIDYHRQLATLVDAAVVVYRSNELSIDQAATLCSMYQRRGKTVVPAINFRFDGEPQAISNYWKKRCFEQLSWAYQFLGSKVAHGESDPEVLYDATGYNFAIDLMFGAENPAMNQDIRDHESAVYRVDYLIKLLSRCFP